MDLDLRRHADLLAYPELSAAIPAPVPGPGDAQSRLLCLCDDIATSRELLVACEQRLAGLDGPVETKLSKIVKVPEAEGYLEFEAPWGPAGVWLVSRAQTTAWRLKLRTPSFANVQALEVALVGCPVDRIDEVVASLGWTAGDLDK